MVDIVYSLIGLGRTNHTLNMWLGVPGANTSINIVLLEKGLGHTIKSQNLGRTHMSTYKFEHKLDLRTYRDVYSSAGHL